MSSHNFNIIYPTIGTTYCTLVTKLVSNMWHIEQPFVWEKSHSLEIFPNVIGRHLIAMKMSLFLGKGEIPLTPYESQTPHVNVECLGSW
jgi:hypothetical protein